MRLSARWTALAGLFLFVVSASFVLPYIISYLAGPEPIWPIRTVPAGKGATLEEGWWLERNGELEKSLEKYRACEASVSAVVRYLCNQNKERVTSRLMWPAQIARDLSLLSTALVAIRLPLLIAGCLIVLGVLLRMAIGKSGLAVESLAVYGARNPRLSRLLRREVAGEIGRRHKEYVHWLAERRDLSVLETGKSLEFWDKLTASTEDFKPQSAVGVAVVQLLTGAAMRPPRYRLTGALWLSGPKPSFRGELTEAGRNPLGIEIELAESKLSQDQSEASQRRDQIIALAPLVAQKAWASLARSKEEVLFLEGFALFARGDFEHASKAFEQLNEALERNNREALKDLQNKYSSGLQGVWALKWLPKPLIRKMVPWIEQFQNTLHIIHGGRWYGAAETWVALKKTREELTNSRKLIRDFNQAHYNLLLGSMRQPDLRLQTVIEEWEKGNDEIRNAAETRLDLVLDKHELWKFDKCLDRIETVLSSIDREAHWIEIGLAEVEPPKDWLSEAAPIIEKAKTQFLGKVFSEKLDEIRDLVASKDWPACSTKVSELRLWVREPSEWEFQQKITELQIPRWQRLFVEAFVPAFRWSRKWKARRRDPLYLEAQVYLSWTRLHFGELKQKEEALDDMQMLRYKLGTLESRSPRDTAIMALAAAVEAALSNQLEKNVSIDSAVEKLWRAVPAEALTRHERAFLDEVRSTVSLESNE